MQHFHDQVEHFLVWCIKYKVPLPNLKSVTVHFYNLYPQFNVIPWITTFISPMLNKFRLVANDESEPESCQPSCYNIDTILEAITRTCLHLRVLEVYGLNNSLQYNYGGDTSQQSFYHQLFQTMLNLCELSSSIPVNDKAGLAMLAALPGLESLSITQGCWEELMDPELAIHADMFPVLKQLSLISFNPALQASLMTLQPLVRNLISVLLSQRHIRDL
jgi:hypothetical protein